MTHDRRSTSILALVGLACIFLAAWLEVGEIAELDGLGSDFAGTIYRPALAVLEGASPYGDPHVSGPLAGSVYPPSAFLAVLWIGLLPHGVAVAVWLALLSIAAFATLWVLGVRDLRCYALWLLTPMVLSTVAIGNATVLVILLAALLWRWRDAAGKAAVALTAAIAVKLFAAPLMVWLIATRRFKAAALTAGGVPLVILLSWAVIGFADIERYPSILSANTDVFAGSGPYIHGLVLQLGYSDSAAYAFAVAAAAMLLGSAWRADDVAGFALASAAAIVLAPVAWIGYTGLLVIPLAARWPRWSAAWLVLLGTYMHWYYAPLRYATPELSAWTIALVALVLSIVLWRHPIGRRTAERTEIGVCVPSEQGARSR